MTIVAKKNSAWTINEVSCDKGTHGTHITDFPNLHEHQHGFNGFKQHSIVQYCAMGR